MTIVAGGLQKNSRGVVALNRVGVFDWPFCFSTDVAVGKIISRDGETSAVGTDQHRIRAHQHKGVRRNRAAPRIEQLNAAALMMRDDICAQGDSVTIAVEDDRRAVALFDHVPGQD